MIRTRVCDVFGIDVPILNAPMASAAGGELAAAVSAAGGLGLIGAMGHDAAWLRAQIRLARARACPTGGRRQTPVDASFLSTPPGSLRFGAHDPRTVS